jgi:hypothetical protein
MNALKVLRQVTRKFRGFHPDAFENQVLRQIAGVLVEAGVLVTDGRGQYTDGEVTSDEYERGLRRGGEIVREELERHESRITPGHLVAVLFGGAVLGWFLHCLLG